ncbi:MAG TPA: amidase family protein, partial [Vicinamibacteria bacterium]
MSSRRLGCGAALLAVLVNGSPAASSDGYDVMEKTISELQAAQREGRVTSRQLVASYRARIGAYDQRGPELNAFITLDPRALEVAEALDRERADRGPRGPLHGIPIVVKDNFESADLPTSGGSIALAGHRPARDAYQVARLRQAGAVILGKTNLHELAAGVTTISSLGGQTRNPYDLRRNPGGSSGGTAAAVAANFAAAGLGSDTCGSIRMPASYNSLVGLRPTLGLSSRAGIIPLSHSQDVGGPLARTVMDVALLLDATAGGDPADAATSAAEGHVPRSYADGLEKAELRGARLGVLKALFGDAPEDEEVAGIVRKAVDAMKSRGADALEVTVPGLSELLRESSTIDSEFKFDLADYLAAAAAPPVRSLAEILERGLYHERAESVLKRRDAVERRDTEVYRKVLVRRAAVRHAVLSAMEEQQVVALAYPALRRKPSLLGEPQYGNNCQLGASSGLPALVVPAGFTEDGLPVGLELLGRPFSEPTLLGLGYAFEQFTHHRRAPASTPALTSSLPPGPVTFTTVATGKLNAPPTESRETVEGRFRWDETTGELTYDVTVRGVAAESVLAASINRGEPGARGPIVAHLLRHGHTSAAGTLALNDRDRRDLLAGRLYIQLFTLEHPGGAARAPLLPDDPGERRLPIVGMVTRDFVDESRRNWQRTGPRPLRTAIWYPAAAITTRETIFDAPPEEQVFEPMEVAPGAPVAAKASMHPLVLLSHGTGGSAVQLMWLGTSLAAQGYIAAAVDHHGNTASEKEPTPQGFLLYWERARDLRVVLDRLLADPLFGPHIDRTRVGAAGFSLGGYTVVEMAGGRFSPKTFDEFCRSPERDFTCEPQPEFPDALARFGRRKDTDPVVQESLRHASDSYRDPRIKGVFAIAPALGGGFTPEGLSSVAVPVR